MKHFMAALALAGLMACTPSEKNGLDHAGHMIAQEGIIISDAWVRPPLPGRDIATAYFHISNTTGADNRLIAVSTDVNTRTEIHTHLNENGVMKMRKLDGLDLPKGETVMFKPGGLHVMMFETALTEDQTDVALTFTFAKSDALTIIAETRDMATPKKMDHSGH